MIERKICIEKEDAEAIAEIHYWQKERLVE